eukprot:1376485-Rhodomonas_salina.3
MGSQDTRREVRRRFFSLRPDVLGLKDHRCVVRAGPRELERCVEAFRELRPSALAAPEVMPADVGPSRSDASVIRSWQQQVAYVNTGHR